MLFVDKYRPKALGELHYHAGLSDRLTSLVSAIVVGERAEGEACRCGCGNSEG